MPKTNLQNSIDFDGQKFYVGIDVHKNSWTVTVRSLGIQVARFVQEPGSPEGLFDYLRKNFPGGVYYSAYEAGFCGTSIHERLCRTGISNIIVNASDIPTTDKQRKNKNDFHDSRSIAEHLEKGNLDGIHILSREQQELRSLFRLRESKVKDVTRANNRLKGYLLYFGIEIPKTVLKTAYLSKKTLEWLNNLELVTDAGSICLRQHVQALRYQREQLYQITKQLRKQIQLSHSKSYAHLLTIPGIGAVTAMGLLAEIADFSRFDDPDEYTSYLGLMPWESSSGDTTKTLGMQPRCNRHLRPLLIEASWGAIKFAPELFAYYSKHAAKGSKYAIVKVARKLASIVKGVVIKQQDYQKNYLKNKKVFKASTEKHIADKELINVG